ncbi:MAG: hypothetical protein RMM98_06590 [Acidobacteriota bacterium]|nr:hypothetical protein [Blastocatellia bacterium]MDW8239266.1 hypothetical protein [Acidobacteriota bacterium]
MKKIVLTAVLLGIFAIPSVQVATAQRGPNDIVILPRVVHGGDPSSTFDSLKALPVVAFADTKVSHPGQFANRHDWALSEDGEEPAVFGINDFFDFSFDLVLNGTPISPRKEAGIIIDTAIAGSGQFIVNTDAHEVVAFGGPFPFYAFPRTYDSGEKINMRLRYFRDTDGKRKIQYYVTELGGQEQTSGPLEITNLEQGIPGPFFIKGYMQVVISTANPDNRAAALFDNIQFNGKLIGN